MTINTELSLEVCKAMEIIKNAKTEDGWMPIEQYERMCAELSKLGINVMTTMGSVGNKAPATDKQGRTFVEVSIHPFVEQIADEDGEPMEGDWCTASGGEWSDEFGDDLDGYPDEMFRKGWSVSSWVESISGIIDDVDDEEFPDYETAIARAEELADQYGVNIEHRY